MGNHFPVKKDRLSQQRSFHVNDLVQKRGNDFYLIPCGWLVFDVKDLLLIDPSLSTFT